MTTPLKVSGSTADCQEGKEYALSLTCSPLENKTSFPWCILVDLNPYENNPLEAISPPSLQDCFLTPPFCCVSGVYHITNPLLKEVANVKKSEMHLYGSLEMFVSIICFSSSLIHQICTPIRTTKILLACLRPSFFPSCLSFLPSFLPSFIMMWWVGNL